MDNMQYEPLVSVIVPCFNSADTVIRCFNSILNQNYKKIEIIAVDDGSTDNTPDLLKSLCKANNNIIYLHCDHGGVSNARNAALKAASGEYIQFVDSDDCITANCTERLVETAVNKKADLVISDFYQSNMMTGEDDMYHHNLKRGSYEKKSFINELAKEPGAHYFGVLWNKFYKKELITKGNLTFPLQLSLGEDFVFNTSYYALCERIDVIDDKLYIYSYGIPNSLTNKNKNFIERMDERLAMYHAYCLLYKKENLKGFWIFKLHFYILRCYSDELTFLGSDAEKWKKELYTKYITDNGISRTEFSLYRLLRTAKQVIRKLKG